MKFGSQETIGRGRADGYRTPVRIDGDLGVDAAQVDQVAGGVGNAVEGVTSADRVDLGRSGDDAAHLVDRGRAMDASGFESVVAGPVLLRAHSSPLPD